MHSAEAMALFTGPKHTGRPVSGRFRHGVGGSVKQGALIELWLQVQSDQIVQARFEAFGCPSTIACGEWLCRWLMGRECKAAMQLSGVELAEALNLDAVKRSVALVAEDALKAALMEHASEVSNDNRR